MEMVALEFGEEDTFLYLDVSIKRDLFRNCIQLV